MMDEYLSTLENEFKTHANPIYAAGQKAYLKNQFEFYGIKTPERRKIQIPFMTKNYLPPKVELPSLVEIAWSKKEREWQYFGGELVYKFNKDFDLDDIYLLEFMITNKSWWDTVDIISTKSVGSYFLKYPEQRDKVIDQWIASGNMWLQRSSVIFQLNYKQHLDKDFLAQVIQPLLGSKEFFINKAIGWILRHYSTTHPDWVIDITERLPLHKLSEREALRILKKKGLF